MILHYSHWSIRKAHKFIVKLCIISIFVVILGYPVMYTYSWIRCLLLFRLRCRRNCDVGVIILLIWGIGYWRYLGVLWRLVSLLFLSSGKLSIFGCCMTAGFWRLPLIACFSLEFVRFRCCLITLGGLGRILFWYLDSCIRLWWFYEHIVIDSI